MQGFNTAHEDADAVETPLKYEISSPKSTTGMQLPLPKIETGKQLPSPQNAPEMLRNETPFSENQAKSSSKPVKKLPNTVEKTPLKKRWKFLCFSSKRMVLALGIFVLLFVGAVAATLVVVLAQTQGKSLGSEFDSEASTPALNAAPTPALTTTESPAATTRSCFEEAVTLISTGCKTQQGVVTNYAGTGVAGNRDGNKDTVAQLQSPNGLAFHPNGSLYVSDALGIHVITGNFMYKMPYFNASNLISNQFAIDSNGIMYLPVSGNYIAAIDTSTSATRVFAGNVSASGGFSANSDPLKAEFANIVATYLHKGKLYAADRGNVLQGGNFAFRVMDICPYSNSTSVKTIYADSENGQKPEGMAIDGDGNFFYSTIYKCINKYVVGSSKYQKCFAGVNGLYGSALTDGPPGTGRFAFTKGIAFDGCGNLFVADRAADRIRMVNSTGYLTTVASVQDPQNIAIGADGDLYVTSGAWHQIKRVRLS